MGYWLGNGRNTYVADDEDWESDDDAAVTNQEEQKQVEEEPNYYLDCVSLPFNMIDVATHQMRREKIGYPRLLWDAFVRRAIKEGHNSLDEYIAEIMDEHLSCKGAYDRLYERERQRKEKNCIRKHVSLLEIIVNNFKMLIKIRSDRSKKCDNYW